MQAIAAALLVALAGPALAQDRSGNLERVETPQGPVTIVRPTPRAQPAPRGPQANPDPVPPPPATPFLGDQDGRRAISPGGPPDGAPYAVPDTPYIVVVPPPVVIQRRGGPGQAPGGTGAARRRFDDVGPVPAFEAPPAGTLRPRGMSPGAPLQSRDGYGGSLPPPRFPPNQYGPGAVPGTLPLPDASQVIILRR